jgi:SAM-dependent methyltransferase
MWAAASGRAPQAFLGASWVGWMLGRVAPAGRRKWALRLLALSPHYFFHAAGLGEARRSLDDWLALEVERSVASRGKICQLLLREHLTRNSVALDYGCGPGFLAKAVAPQVERVYGCDTSLGALACARAINPDDRIEYHEASPRGMSAIPAGSVDVVFSIAVAQHLTDEALANLLATSSEKLKPGGRLLLHVQILGDGPWRSWAQWRGDKSLRGRIRYRFGLHCFGRDEADLLEIVSRSGFKGARIRPIRDLVDEDFDDICKQHLLTAERA